MPFLEGSTNQTVQQFFAYRITFVRRHSSSF
jgi:hypothetical protein